MSGRNHGPSTMMKGLPAYAGVPPRGMHEPPPFVRGLRPMPPHPFDDFREPQYLGIDPLQLPPHPALIEESLAAQHQEIQGLLTDNQRLAATHVALKQELETAQHELRRMTHFADLLQGEDTKMRELYDKSTRLEADLLAVESTKRELQHVLASVKDLSDVKLDLNNRIQSMTADLARYNADLQQIPGLKAEIDSRKHELQRARAAIDYEKKGYADNYEHGVAMEKNLVTMARELEKLRAEIANVDKRVQPSSAAVVGNSAYASYGNPEMRCVGYPHPGGYGTAQVQHNAESYARYGNGTGSWGMYEMQRTQGQR